MQFTRSLKTIILIAVLLPVFSRILVRAQQSAFTVAIRWVDNTVPSDALIMRAELKNNSAHKMTSTRDCALRILLRDSQGNAAPKSEHQIELENQKARQPTLRRVGVTIPPGQIQKCEFVISYMYKLEGSASYTIQIERDDFDGGIRAKSNILTFQPPKSYSASRTASTHQPPVANEGAVSQPKDLLASLPRLSMDPPVSMQLILSPRNPTVGSQISITAVTTNISHSTIAVGLLPWPYQSETFGLVLAVRDNDNNNLPVGPQEMDQHACEGESHCQVLVLESRYLPPGKSITDHFVLDGRYKLSKPGRYTMQIVRWEKHPDGSGPKEITAVSNFVIFHILEPGIPGEALPKK